MNWSISSIKPLKALLTRIDKARDKLRGNRPQHTLVYVAKNRLLRVDLDREGRFIGNPLIVDCDCATADALPTVLPRSLMGLPRPARKLWVLYEALPFYTLSLPSSQVTDVKPEQLRQALLFELEQMAGIGADNKQLAFSLFANEDGMNHYTVSLAPAKVFEQLQKSARKSACRLYGLAYAGAVPRRLHLDVPPGPWARLEYWANGVVGLHGTAEGVQGVLSFQEIPAKRLESELERWLKSLGLSVGIETLVTAPGINAPLLGDIPLSLENRDNLEEWLQAWATAISTGSLSGVPLFRPTVTPEQELNMTIGLASAALALCLVHFGWYHHQSTLMEGERDRLKKTEQKIKTFNEGIKKQQEKRDGIVKALDKIKGQHVSLPLVLDALRRRPAMLLRDLALHRTDDVVVERIVAEKDAVVVEGASLKPAAANDLSALLEPRMDALGWRMAPPEKKDMGLFAGGGPWSFKMRLTDNGLAGFVLPKQAEKTGGGR